MTAFLPPARFLALGDSYTIGEGVAPEDRWPAQLARALRAAGYDVADPEIIATTGWTTDELMAGIEAASPRGPYQLVTLLIGVNDQYRGRPVSAYREPFVRLLRRAIALAGGDASRAIALSIPDWGVTPFAEGRDRARIAREIEAYNAVNREEASHAGARYVDVLPSSRRAASDSSLLAPDGLHPSWKMYAEWCGVMLPVARAAAVSGRG